MKVEKILVVSEMHNELEKIMEKHKIQKDFRFLSNDQASKEDYHWADVLVSFRPPANFEFGNIKWAHSLGAGVDAFLNLRQWKSNVLLTRMVNAFGEKMSEYCLSYILKELQHHDLFDRFKKEKLWEPTEPKTLSSQKVVIYGTGEIGQVIAKNFSALGMRVFGISLSGRSKDSFQSVVTPSIATSLLKEADWVINTLPLTNDTYKVFDEGFFKLLDHVGFINVGRGASVDEGALRNALDKGSVKKAILDVFPEEPLPKDSLLWDHPDVVITPHISAVTTPEEGANCFLETLKKVEGNEKLKNKVDVEKGY